MYNDDITKSVAQTVAEILEKKKIKTETEVQKANKDFVDLHAVDDKKDPEQEKQTESKDEVEEGNEFTKAAAKAKLAGKDKFEFEGKTYPVEIDQDAAEKILGKKESIELEEANNRLVAHSPAAAARLIKKLMNKFSGYKWDSRVKGDEIIYPNEPHIIRFIKKQPEVANMKEEVELEEAKGFPESSQGAKQTYDAVVKLSASLKKGSNLNKAVNKRLGGKYDSDFVKMEKAITVIFDILEELDREYQGFES